ncbi:hypothetical protein Pcinc_021015 [Petrolisthes cinctipes]|uniref:Uncharacterized protein n=1 Tax=Petrolisthes cinctipes TaxID=88211 RepID=A0AAE1FGS8_PETCI|nr:hypothetical protein Pcinc_021015 [Petrolisthes cinctipes]
MAYRAVMKVQGGTRDDGARADPITPTPPPHLNPSLPHHPLPPPESPFLHQPHMNPPPPPQHPLPPPEFPFLHKPHMNPPPPPQHPLPSPESPFLHQPHMNPPPPHHNTHSLHLNPPSSTSPT